MSRKNHKSTKSPAADPITLRNLKFRPLTPDLWRDFEELFGDRGACGGCWCMWWRLARSEFEKRKGLKNKSAMKKIVNAGAVPGILAFKDEHPIGWCCVGPREVFPSLARSRVLKPIDDRPVWSIVCFFIARAYRKSGVSVQLIKAAVRFARHQGATVVESYPQDLKKTGAAWADAFIWTGVASAFRQAGFVEVARRSPSRPIMRYSLTKTRANSGGEKAT